VGAAETLMNTGGQRRLGSGFREMDVWFTPPTEEGVDRKKPSAHKAVLAKRLQTSSRPNVMSQRGAPMDLAGVQRVTCSPLVRALRLHARTHARTHSLFQA
jgi:hypothetical protein